MSQPPPPRPEAADARRRKFLGEMLRDQGVISGDQLAEVLALQKREKGTRIGRLLVDLGYATETCRRSAWAPTTT